MNDTATFTYQTRFYTNDEDSKKLDTYAKLLSKVERALHAKVAAGEKSTDLKNSFLKEYNITARQFNSCRVSLEGKIASIKARKPALISQIKEKITSLKKTIKSLLKKNKAFAVHQKKRRLIKTEHRLEALQKSEHVSLCFGSKKLFHTQFHLEKSGYQNLQEWKNAWQEAREAEFFLMGSKDETAGNQSCVATINEDQTLSLRLRLPKALEERYGKYLLLPSLNFSYGQDKITQTLEENLARKTFKNKELGKAISYRFKKDRKGWRVFVSLSLTQEKPHDCLKNGAIGVDLNADHVALTETDRFGNPIKRESIPLVTYGKSSQQAKALVGDVTAQIVKLAQDRNKPIIIEKLDFQKKKAQLRGNTKYCRMLSSFAYNAFRGFLHSRSFRNKVLIYEVNPAYTSIIGRVKFAKRYGLSIHHAAALCIARRKQGFSECLPKSLEKIPDGKNGHVALPLPVRNRGEHVWKFWARVLRKLPVALAAHFRAKKIDPGILRKPILETG